MLTAAKNSLTILINIAGKSTERKTFDGEMLIPTLPTTLLEVFCIIILNFKVNVKRTTVSDNNFWENVTRETLTSDLTCQSVLTSVCVPSRLATPCLLPETGREPARDSNDRLQAAISSQNVLIFWGTNFTFTPSLTY